MGKPSVVLPYLFPAEAVKLGSVLTNLEEPTQSKYVQDDLEISKEAKNLLISPGVSYKDLQQHDREAGLSAILQHISKATLSKTHLSSLALDTKRVLTYHLADSDNTFATVAGSNEFRTWLETTRKRKHTYFIVGIQTLADASIDINESRASEAAAEVRPPTDQAGVEVQLEAHAKKAAKRETHFISEGEQIWAIQYRQIKLDSFLAKDPSQIHLSSNQQWVAMIKTRSTKGTPIYTASLVDNDPGEDFQKVLLGADQPYFVSEEILKKCPGVQASQKPRHPPHGDAAAVTTARGSPAHSPRAGGSGGSSSSSGILPKTQNGRLHGIADPSRPQLRPSANKQSPSPQMNLRPDRQAALRPRSSLSNNSLSRGGPSARKIHVDPPIQKSNLRPTRKTRKPNGIVESGEPRHLLAVGRTGTNNGSDRQLPVRPAPGYRDRT